MAVYTYQVKVTTAKDIRKVFMDSLVKEALEKMNVSVEEKGSEHPTNIEVISKK